MTRKQSDRAIKVLSDLSSRGTPDMVTPREATDLCKQYGITNDRFRRIAKREQHCRPISLAAVAAEIAKKEAIR